MLDKLLSSALRHSIELAGLEDVIEKEILHHDILYILHKHGLLDNLTFMGGTALRLCYGGNRLSEDLDFAAGANFTPESLSGLENEFKTYLHAKYGLNISVHTPKLEKGNTSTWKVTIEKHPNRPDLPSQKMHIDVCTVPSFEPTFKAVVDHYNIGSSMAGVIIPVQSLNELMTDKMIAFAYRERRIKPRDVWDIVWLAQQRVDQSKDLLEAKLSARGKKVDNYLKKLTSNLDSLLHNDDYKKDFSNEMSRFVSKSVAQNTLDKPQFWPYVQETINSECGKVINALTNNAQAIEFKM